MQHLSRANQLAKHDLPCLHQPPQAGHLQVQLQPTCSLTTQSLIAGSPVQYRDWYRYLELIVVQGQAAARRSTRCR
jgi:hypothetical protein